mmetsp:Transcript_24831/g.36438  ORF Transcript_24831/g.36438 Transcript_24831/m.36438 type:complete len:115 (+) Transcript_24831:217-561(+)
MVHMVIGCPNTVHLSITGGVVAGEDHTGRVRVDPGEVVIGMGLHLTVEWGDVVLAGMSTMLVVVELKPLVLPVVLVGNRQVLFPPGVVWSIAVCLTATLLRAYDSPCNNTSSLI